MRRCTTTRYRALKWFSDHESDPASVLLGGWKPSTKMRRLMAREGQVFRMPIGQFGYERWLLTDKGRELLSKKHRKERSTPDDQAAHI